MRLKHNKKRNTAFVYEALIRELTTSIIKKNRNKQNKIVSIIKEHFHSESSLNEELGLYRSIYETTEIDKNLAEKIVSEAKVCYSKLDKKKIFKEQSNLINKINRVLSNKIFTKFVPNYKSLASVYSIFNEKLPVHDRVLLEERIVGQMSSSVDHPTEDIKEPIDNIVYKTFTEQFNKEYSEGLLEEQKELLTRYISSFSDNSLSLKIFLNEEVGRLRGILETSRTKELVTSNPDIDKKITEVLEILESYKKVAINEDMMEEVLKIQKLAAELGE